MCNSFKIECFADRGSTDYEHTFDTMSQESRAAETIVCNCRIFLSRKRYHRLKLDLGLFYERIQNRDRHQNTRALCIQRVFRGYQCRRQYRNMDREKAVELANLSFQNTIAYNLKTRIQHLEDKRGTLNSLFQIREKSLTELQQRIENRVVKVRSGSASSFFIDSSLKSYEAILNSIKDELDIVSKMRVKNHAHVLRLQENFSTIQHNDNVILSISKFLNRSRKDLPFYHNNKGGDIRNDIVERMRLACDHDLERILYRENHIVDADIAALLRTSQISTLKIDILMKLRGYEVENHCLHLYVQKKQVKTLEAAHIIEWIDSVQDKLYKCKKELGNVFHDLEIFYKEEEDRVNTIVLFFNQDGILNAKCKISPLGEPVRFDYKKWKEDYQQCVEAPSKDSPHHLAMVQLRDYVEERCKFLRENCDKSYLTQSENQMIEIAETGREVKGIVRLIKAYFVGAERSLSNTLKKVMRRNSIVPFMEKS